MLSFLTSEPSTLYKNLNSSKGYHQVGFEQLDLIKDVPDHGKGEGVCAMDYMIFKPKALYDSAYNDWICYLYFLYPSF